MIVGSLNQHVSSLHILVLCPLSPQKGIETTKTYLSTAIYQYLALKPTNLPRNYYMNMRFIFASSPTLLRLVGRGTKVLLHLSCSLGANK